MCAWLIGHERLVRKLSKVTPQVNEGAPILGLYKAHAGYTPGAHKPLSVSAMAATSTKKFFHLLAVFVLLLTQLTDSAFLPKSKIKNHTELLKPQATTKTYIVHCNQHAKPPHFADLEQWYQSMVTAHSSPVHGADYTNTTSGRNRMLYTYDTVMHGFAVRLTGDEARRMSSSPGVTRVHEDRTFYLQTTRSPGFMGLEPHHGAWNETDFGDGVIIGLIDGGIWPESASFSDRGLGPVRPSWRGKCVDAADFNSTLLCNRKLVGARAFDVSSQFVQGTVPSSPRDKDGHGTHVASTAAGAEVPGAGMFMFSRGTARGVAPKARIAMYNACGVQNCQTADIVAAVDAAVKDGVDVISMSLGDRPMPFYNDAIAISTFAAERSGIFVALAGGNSGPEAWTVSNVAPWMTTVGAATIDRVFPAKLTLGNGVVLPGQSLYTMRAKGTGMVRLMAANCEEEYSGWTPDKVMGKIVVCIDDVFIDDEFGVLLQKAGGAGIVLVDPTEWAPDGGAEASPFTLPGLRLGVKDHESLKAYMASDPNPVASFSFGCETVTGRTALRWWRASRRGGPTRSSPSSSSPTSSPPE
ncbi:hypothetical protein QOZ80_7BG0605760 [Eleusine coracana subsp. coracana]|nr:hypothetical protein QOZ80_7BG0605710 [Eleusine coracana subsp. coracana]KAK3125499.1 hypothetical protein QOZ80_7BG0605760 [Eleusine coracana subsp. coracana]